MRQQGPALLGPLRARCSGKHMCCFGGLYGKGAGVCLGGCHLRASLAYTQPALFPTQGTGAAQQPATYYELIARDKEVVKMVLLLTGSVEGTKQQVAEYTQQFERYSFLWKDNLQAT